MKVQNHINMIDGTCWYRCKSVEFRGDTAVWELNRNGRYSFVDAYRKTPQIQLAQATDDGSLRAFVKAWGPLRSSVRAWGGYQPTLSDWSGSDQIESYRKIRNKVRALVRLLASADDPESQRTCLLELVGRAPGNEEVRWFAGAVAVSKAAGLERGVTLSRWLEMATPSRLDEVTRRFLSAVAAPHAAGAFTAVNEGGSYVLKESFNFNSSAHAFFWMVWQDVYKGREFHSCEECGKLFQPDTRHARKFCSDECAHRKTARDWQQRKRQKERNANGTQKAR